MAAHVEEGRKWRNRVESVCHGETLPDDVDWEEPYRWMKQSMELLDLAYETVGEQVRRRGA